MCYVPRGMEVKTRSDLQNLTTHVVFTTTGRFSAEDIVAGVREALGDNHAFDSEIEQRVAKTISVFELNDSLSYAKGKFFVKSMLHAV